RDRVDDLLIGIAQGRMAQEPEVPVLRVMQVRETAVDERTHEVERERGAFIASQQQFRIRLAVRRGERRAGYVVPPAARQRHPRPSFAPNPSISHDTTSGGSRLNAATARSSATGSAYFGC